MPITNAVGPTVSHTMNTQNQIYKTPLGLLTDLYQLTMAFGYWKSGLNDREAVFNLFYRKNPFGGEFALACGLESVIHYLNDFCFQEEDIDYLRGLTGNDGRPLFESEFLDWLLSMEFSCDVLAIPEGTVVFPHEPLVRVTGPLIQGQLIETALLNLVNFQTLIATKSARICMATGGDPVLEFGLRRAQGIDGALSASRSAYVGGCAATSNVLAGKIFGIPVKGTHAHSWVMTFDDELESFEAYAAAMPNNCVFLVDTYDTLEGVKKAILAGQRLKEKGYEMVGIRLDSGDLAQLSIDARQLLDEAGFDRAAIVASNDLNEALITELKEKGATINVWGVGTKLATAYDQPALGGVYKLAAIRDPGEEWRYRLKLSNEPVKVSNPGLQQVRRFSKDGQFRVDVIYDERLGIPNDCQYNAFGEADLSGVQGADHEDLLVPVFDAGRQVYKTPDLDDVRKRTQEQLARLPEGSRQLFDPVPYTVGLEKQLHELKLSLMEQAREDLSVSVTDTK